MKEAEFLLNKKLIATSPIHSKHNIELQFLRQWGDVAKNLLKEDWGNAYMHSATMFSNALHNLCRLGDEFSLFSRESMLFDFTLNKIQHIPIEEILANEAKKKAIIETLKSKGISKSIISKVKELEPTPHSSLKQKQAKITDQKISQLQRKANIIINQGFTGYWSTFHSLFNSYVGVLNDPLVSSDRKMFNTKISLLEEKTRKQFMVFYSLYNQEDTEKLKQQSINSLLWVYENVDFIARLCALSYISVKEVSKTPKNLWQQSLHTGIVARKMAFLAVLSLYSYKVSLYPEGTTIATNEFKASQHLKFTSAIKDGKNIDLEKLIHNQGEYWDKYIEVEGIVKNVHIKDTSDGKLISQFDLTHYKEKKSIPVVAIFEDLKHMGINDGAFARVNGVLKEQSSVLPTPYIQISQVKLSVLKKESWQDYMLDKLSEVFEFYPNSYFISWSVSPEDKKGKGQKSPHTGASEILFKKKLQVSAKL